MNDTFSTSPASDRSGGHEPTAPLPRKVMIVVSVALGFVVLAPVLLSSQDLWRWAQARLGLSADWAWLVPVALDCAAAACIGMAIVATWRRERPGIFGLLVWVFAGTSAVAQYRNGISEIHLAPDAYWAFPAFALLGPLLLHFVMGRLRKWARQDVGEQQTGAAGFGSSWIPGVAFRETVRAWAASRREGINRADDARAYVRQVAALRGMAGQDAVRYAVDALHGTDPYAIRAWLQARHVEVTQAEIDAGSVRFAEQVAELNRELAALRERTAQSEQTLRAQFAQAVTEAEQKGRTEGEQAARTAAEQVIAGLREQITELVEAQRAKPEPDRTDTPRKRANPQPTTALVSDEQLVAKLWPLFARRAQETGSVPSRHWIETNGPCFMRQANRVRELLTNRWTEQAGEPSGTDRTDADEPETEQTAI